jgi:hypothetical protein
MSADLFPRDELTLNRLAQVLAKMYRFAIEQRENSADDSPPFEEYDKSIELGDRDVAQPEARRTLDRIRRQRKGQRTARTEN